MLDVVIKWGGYGYTWYDIHWECQQLFIGRVRGYVQTASCTVHKCRPIAVNCRLVTVWKVSYCRERGCNRSWFWFVGIHHTYSLHFPCWTRHTERQGLSAHGVSWSERTRKSFKNIYSAIHSLHKVILTLAWQGVYAMARS